MLSFKDTLQPLYDDHFYLETDLDTIDDQPIDYSKRFVDEEPDAVCGSSAGKKKHPSVNVDPPKVPGDELKVYCFEGTPLLISSASSLCDLREIGVLLQASETEALKEHLGKKPDFQASSNINEDTHVINCEVEIEKHEPTQPEEKEECSKEEEYINFQTEGNFSKTSSPLMFSRSSSVCSLNSYENQSIVDDRSSVSIFSTLPSGIISPSEIPDSPGEVMSPFVHKGKQTEFLFPSNNNERSMDPVLAKIKMNSDQSFDDNAFEDIPEEDNIKVYNDEGDCSSMTNLSDLSIQIDSSRLSVSVVHHKNTFSNVDHKSSIIVNCSISTTGTVQNHGTDDLDSSKVEVDCALSNTNCAEVFSYTDSGTMLTNNYAAQDEGMTDFSFQNLVLEEEEECKKDGTSTSKNVPYHDDYEHNPVSFEEEPDETITFLQESESPEFSKDNSDDETDALLEECIKSGMPSKNIFDHRDSQQSLTESSESNQMLISKEDIHEQSSSFSDNDLSEDESDLLLESCIQLGMPQKLSDNQTQDEKLKDLQTQVINSNSIEDLNICSNNSNVPDMMPANYNIKESSCNIFLPENADNCETPDDCNNSDDDDDDNELLNQCIKLGRSNTNQEQKKIADTHNSSTFHPINKNKKQLEIVKTEIKKSNEDESDESDIDVQHCIQLGRPINGCKSSNDKKITKEPDSPNIKELGCRDNCPDGTSDVDDDDDDDILSECIRAGMPNRKSLISEPKMEYVLPNKNQSLKPQLRRKSPASEDRAMFLKKCCFSSSTQSSGYLRDASVSPTAVVDDSMYVYTTEDTPILSPSASISDLSTLSFNDDKSCQESFLNNSRNSDCSSESEDDELLLQCIRSGMPDEKRAVE